ncbi:LOW QUALITY PROTEIN: hypothetical protein MAR_010514 [Mya arenaria]|uniref:C2H2-type domain-containing protein n=1 Tax=Mya arenaria TaxID=6604 RepID=A0ABY7E9Y4_MYAAR|nr:LOW QUALITY PROTEIN: hypothetical protein MAR_010514 [Mya arenaria]
MEILETTSKDQFAAYAAKIVKNECETICKRHSDFALTDKTYEGIMEFSWDHLYQDLLLGAPNTLRIVSSMVTSSIPMPVPSKEFHHALFAIGIILHGRNREATTLQYLNGMVLLHGGCTHQDMKRLAKLGVCVFPETVRNKLQSWQSNLDEKLLEVKEKWCKGDSMTYQLVGDNWDKNIVPSYRTSKNSTQSIHLFNVIGVIDRIVIKKEEGTPVRTVDSMTAVDFIPSEGDIDSLQKELTFLVARSVIQNIKQMEDLFGKIYPGHLEHIHSNEAGMKTSQYSLGLFDCDEKKTADVIRLLQNLTEKYVPKKDGEIVEEVFFGGDRLTDEKIQVAQQAMRNADSGLERLEGFISKIEDFHRLMNFLEAIHRLSYNTQSSRDRGTVHYYRNLLNARNVKGEVKNSYRAYKQLYYTLFDAICCVLFLKKFELDSCDSTIPVPQGIKDWEADQQLQWLNDKCGEIVKEIFPHDLFAELQNVLADPDHEENYWVNSIENDNFKCHFCNSRYKYVTSLKRHEKTKHQVNMSAKVQTTNSLLRQTDELNDYLVSVFRLTALHQNLNSAVDMGDGYRVVRSAKFETPIYNRTNKVKYLIGSGKNNNLSLDEFVEILNRDTKNATHGFQTKDSIVQHSKEFPHLVHAVKHFDAIKKRKGFHKLPSYKEDVKKVLIDLLSINGLEVRPGRTLHCRKIVQKSSNPFSDCFVGLPVMIARHKPELPFRRLRNKNMPL